MALYDASQTLLNQPSLHFAFQPDNNSTPERQPLAGGAGALQIGDVAAPASPSSDTDGHPDLVVAQPQTGHIAVLANDPANAGHSRSTAPRSRSATELSPPARADPTA